MSARKTCLGHDSINKQAVGKHYIQQIRFWPEHSMLSTIIAAPHLGPLLSKLKISFVMGMFGVLAQAPLPFCSTIGAPMAFLVL